jgi:hypothetical protein
MQLLMNPDETNPLESASPSPIEKIDIGQEIVYFVNGDYLVHTYDTDYHFQR